MASVNDLIGNYRLIKEIASGSFGSVYHGEHAILSNRKVAIKLLHSTHLNSQHERDSFILEAKLLEQLRHRYILSIIDVGIHNGFPYLVTEFAPNGSLRNRLERKPGQPLPVQDTFTILAQVGQALQHAHQYNIIHRDLKPENILFNSKGEVLLADFGIAKVYGSQSLQQATIVGTPAYMAPEQFRGLLCKESDQYALGCIAYELFTGHKPFMAPDFISMGFKHMMEQPIAPRQLNPNLPVTIESAILKAMSKEHNSRHADIATFITALRLPQKTKEQCLDEGDAYSSAKRYDEALASYEYAIRLDPSCAEAYNGKGLMLHHLQHFEEAFAAYGRAIQLDPTLARAYYNLGIITLLYLQQTDQALVYLERAVQLDPTDTEAYKTVLTVRESKRQEDIVAAYDPLEQFDLSDPHSYKDYKLRARQSKEDFLAEFEYAIQLDPTDIEAYNKKGLILHDLKRYNEALAAFEHAIQLDPTDTEAYCNKGNKLRVIQHYEQALATFERAIQLNPMDPDSHVGKGNVLHDLKRYYEALDVYESAIQLDPTYADSYYHQGLTLELLGKEKQAQQAFDKANGLGYLG